MLLGILLLCIGSISFGQPMIVEWETDILHDEPNRFVGINDVCAAEDGEFYWAVGAWGNAIGSWEDSSEAWVVRLGLDGHVISSSNHRDPVSDEFFCVTPYSGSRALAGAKGNILYQLSEIGGIAGAQTICDSTWGPDLNDIVVVSDDLIIAGGRCSRIVDDYWFENGVVSAIAADGSVAWEVAFDTSRHATIVDLHFTIANEIVALVDYYSSDNSPAIARISLTGELLSYSPLSNNNSSSSVLINDDGSYSYCVFNLTDHMWHLIKKDATDEVVSDVTVSLGSHFHGTFVKLDDGHLLAQVDSGFVCLSNSGDSLWEQPVTGWPKAYPTPDGGLLTTTEYRAGNFFGIHFKKFSSAQPRIATHVDSLEFETTLVGSESGSLLPIFNSGIDSFQISADVPEGFRLFLLDDLWIHQGDTTTVPVVFAPTEARHYEGTLTLRAIPGAGVVTVHLVADAQALNAPIEQVPHSFALLPPYPNPFNATTTIEFELPRSADVSLKVYDMQGRLVTTLVDEVAAAGVHSVSWSCVECASGLYFVRMNAGGFVATQKLMLVK